jgi:cytochrome c peroxidase
MAIGDGAIKTFPLRGIKDSPPYLHDGRLLTLEDTVEFFNMVLGTKLDEQEKRISWLLCRPSNALAWDFPNPPLRSK